MSLDLLNSFLYQFLFFIGALIIVLKLYIWYKKKKNSENFSSSQSTKIDEYE